MKSCYTHLLSNVPKKTEEEVTVMYDKPVNEISLEGAKTKINLKNALEKEIITKEEYSALNTEDKDAANFYCNFKVQKQTEHKEVPPVRPIISGSGSITENISYW